ncbi:sensor histidine kinase [Sphingomicrobium lutaoense]|uniref:histidine kinase n=1 Tax=Sphingomicrobium lutaoense TaxID=515949 RepID=A0A839YY59_9SPHN|nr:PAS domain-containing sensor histidine kinase [Sphingomicrobium lutaoense]MBB3763420.1 sigma-B regulation protein RsbU (phosphoserine phosphatase) [Sphingomicrobium lutaoense]
MSDRPAAEGTTRPNGGEDFADLYDHAPCGYVSLDPERHIVNINRTLADWLGRDVDDLLGRPVSDILSFGGKIAFETHIAPRLLLESHVDDIALDLVAAGGEKLPVIANAATKRDPQGAVRFVRLTLLAAAERRNFERGLIAARARAEAESEAQRSAAETREQFIAVLGHDLRNPIAAIEAGIRALRRADEAKREQILDAMAVSSKRAHDIIENVMDLARGRLGQGMQLSIERNCDIGPVVDHVTAEMQQIFPDCIFEKDHDDLGPVDCDPQRIGQLLSNLLSNAVHHGDCSQPIRVSARTDRERFRLSVVNAGDMIPPEHRALLFEPFRRAKAEGHGPGLGLGLFICQMIASAHGGKMALESDPVRTIFTLDMPRGFGD